MSDSAAASQAARAWPADALFGRAAPGAIGMWVFLVSDAFSFAGLLIAHGALRAAGGASWRAPGEPDVPLGLAAFLTVLLIATSLTGALASGAAAAGRTRRAAQLLAVTALGGALFLAGQAQEWVGLWSPGLMRRGLLFGHSGRASTFYAATGYHALHVLVGVIALLAVTAGLLRGRVAATRVEALSLYWCFVDLVWVFIFSFLYLFP